jgi:Tfp pilus assembly protein PilX
MNINKVFTSRERGSILLSLIITLPFLILITTAYLSLSVNSFRVARKDQFHTHAQFAADAGVDYAIQQINQDSTWTGTVSEVTFHTSTDVKTTYTVTVIDNGSNKTVTSIGRTYWPAAAATSDNSVQVSVDLRPVSSGNYSIVTGVGGLIMKNSSKIVNGNVYVNGKLTMSNTSQIGLSILPVDVKVAHQSCPNPPDATYPRVCGGGENGEPITLNNSAHIYGRVEATNQTNGAGMTNTGLVAGSSVPAIALPDYDRDAQKAAALSPVSGVSAGCNAGLKTWPANSKFTGDVEVKNLCAVTVEGDIWITGSLEIENLAALKVKEGLATPPVIMIDGSNGLRMNNASSMLPNLSSVGFRVITYYSNGACSPDCVTVTGNDLALSQQHVTIAINNSSSGARTEFYAKWSKLTAGNNGSVGALAGQTVELQNSLAVTFGTSVTGFGDTIWVINGYRRTF